MSTWRELLASADTSQTLERALKQAGNSKTKYRLGTGGFDPTKSMASTCDCSGFVAWCIGVPRELPPGSDRWLDTDAFWSGGGSIGIGLFDRVELPSCAPGDVLVFPDSNGHQGHVGIVSEVQNARPTKTVHCSGRRNGIAETDSSVFLQNAKCRAVRVDYGALRHLFGVSPVNGLRPPNPPIPPTTELRHPLLAGDETLRRIAATGRPVLQNTGTRMGGVATIQDALNLLATTDAKFAIKFSNPMHRGIFGTKTEAAVRAFQTAAKIKVDGEIGHATLIKLDEMLREIGGDIALVRPARPKDGSSVYSARFERAIRFAFEWECVTDSRGRVIAEEDPDDPGGLTKFGIDKAAHPSLGADFIRNMTEAQAKEIYFNGEWRNARAEELPPLLGEISFDMTIFDGTGRAMTALQGAVGANVTGKWTDETFNRATALMANHESLPRAADRMLDWRAARYYVLVENKPKLRKFLGGWLNRTNALRKALDVPDFHS